MAGYYQGLLKAQGDIEGLEGQRSRRGLLDVQSRAAAAEFEDYQNNAPFRQALQQEKLKEAQAQGPLRQAQTQNIGQEMKGRELEILGKAKELFSSVGDQGQLEQANAQFEQFTGKPSPYRGRPFTPDFREKVTNDLMTIGQRLQAKQIEAGKWHYDADRGGLVNLQTGEFKPATQGGQPMGGKQLQGSELVHFVDTEGNHPPPGTRQTDLLPQGYRPVGTGQLGQIQAGRGAEATISQLEKLATSIWGKSGEDKLPSGLIGRGLANTQLATQRVTQSNPDLNLFESFSAGTLAPLIRAVGEKGNLSDTDIKRAMALIPSTGGVGSFPDSPDVARGKLKQLRAWFEQNTGMGTGAQNYGKRGGDKLRVNPDGSFTYTPR